MRSIGSVRLGVSQAPVRRLPSLRAHLKLKTFANEAMPCKHLLPLVFYLVRHAAAVAESRQHDTAQTPGSVSHQRRSAFVQSGADNPVTRVVNLLKEMGATLKGEMDEDKSLYDKLMCWCHDGNYDKQQDIENEQNTIESLESKIEGLTASSKELRSSIKSIQANLAEDKSALAEATKLRNQQAAEFSESEKDSIEALENLKAALVVLSKHEGAAFPQLQAPLSLLVEEQRDFPWVSGHESRLERSFDDFVRKHHMQAAEGDLHTQSSSHQFLQHKSAAPHVASSHAKSSGWSADEMSIVQRALRFSTSLMQRHGHQYYPSYTSQSGEILGVLRTLQEQMKDDLSSAQQTEATQAANFAELRTAKTAEIEAGEAMEERKEDELAATNNDLANAKEELKKSQEELSADQKYLLMLTTKCKDATANFEARKASRMEEIKAVSETIGILTSDETRDNFKATYSFMQASTDGKQRRTAHQQAAAVLRRAAAKSKMPELSVLASSVELDSFTKVKKAIDGMIAMLKQQQEDEVKKTDYCKSEIQQNEMDTAKAESLEQAQEASIAKFEESIKQIEADIAAAKAEIATLELELQSATKERVAESKEFQKTIADQRMTQSILKAALERLSAFYDEESFAQTGSKQTPPQMEYKKNEASTGVMQLIEKIIYDAKGLEKESHAAEQEAVLQYEALTAETNDSVASLQKKVVLKSKEKAETLDDKRETEEDLADNKAEIAGLVKYNGDLHGDCDYVLKNFGIRQEARAQEIEALNEAKAILSGAKLAF